MKLLLMLSCFLLLFNGTKAQYADELISKLHQPEELKKDIDLVRKKLKKEHPNLYWYIDENKLDQKFDSLKLSIKTPLKSVEFNAKLMTVLSAVGDGHLVSFLDTSPLTEADYIKFNRFELPPVFQFEYRILNDRLFITKNLSKDESLIPGTEVLSIDDEPVKDILTKLKKAIQSDGYNETYKYALLNFGQFPAVHRSIYGWRDSVKFDVKLKDTVRPVVLKTYKPENTTVSKTVVSDVIDDFKVFPPDYKVAYFKIGTFNNVGQRSDYKYVFEGIRQNKSNILILDLRDNLGGDYFRCVNTFSGFIDKPTLFIRRPVELIKGAILPSLDKQRRQQLDFLKAYGVLYPVMPDSNTFKGKLYVLINGGSFSATSLLAANLQAMDKATFVGEETGGGRNGCTGGFYINEVLPNSKVTIRFGIVPYKIPDQSTVKGRGIMPDVPIQYTIEDYLAKKDLEMEWVLKDIGKNKGSIN
ncbi:S41 family peptidase [Pedobacter frigoris]|uniref:S41 family peptidase n=1 Tax=Pedobacter frigoris TaxID=2571272 RepID=UPI00292E70C4|nr:S41 family peptidase [Pedobacter frigoris]